MGPLFLSFFVRALREGQTKIHVGLDWVLNVHRSGSVKFVIILLLDYD